MIHNKIFITKEFLIMKQNIINKIAIVVIIAGGIFFTSTSSLQAQTQTATCKVKNGATCTCTSGHCGANETQCWCS